MSAKQIIIDTIKDKFKGQAMDARSDCQYRLGEKRCAVGLFIPDDHTAIRYGFAGSYQELIESYCDIREVLPIDDDDFWRDFQLRHDNMHQNIEVNDDNIEEQKQYLIDFVEEEFKKNYLRERR